MPKPARIEDAPHHLKLLGDYGKTATTISLALLSVSIAFADKVGKFPFDSIQAALVVLLWLSLVLALVAGLWTVAHVNAVSYYYMKAYRVAYPDALAIIKGGAKVKLEDPGEEVEVTDPGERDRIDKGLEAAMQKTRKAYRCANASIVALGLSAALMVLIGVYSSIYRAKEVDASAAVDTSLLFAARHYRFSEQKAQFLSLTYNDHDKTFLVAVRNMEKGSEEYEITIDGSSGDVTKVKVKP